MVKAGVAAATGQTQDIDSRIEPLGYTERDLGDAGSDSANHDRRIHRDED